MTLRVYTARISYRGADRLDVTRMGEDPIGIVFAPSWNILGPMIRLRRAQGVEAERLAWPQYVRDYTAEMRSGYRDNRPDWDALLSRDEVTLCCFCSGDPAYCHRTLLAEILGKLGANVCGERT